MNAPTSHSRLPAAYTGAPIDDPDRTVAGDLSAPSDANADPVPTLPKAADDAPPPQAEWPVVPGYQILSVLGRGGMGVVYKALQVGLGRYVALKMILGGAHASPEDMVRFLAEGEAVAQLQHTNIVQIYQVGRHGDLPFFSLEYVDGGSLVERLNGTPQPPRDAARLIECLTRAMHLAHQKGIIHRDLKPSNILLANGVASAPKERITRGADATPLVSSPRTSDTASLADCTPKITDFGLAKRVEAGPGLTQTGAILGTPSYMAPEQAEGKKNVGPAADIYALGAILYEMLTGRPPFKAATALDTVLQVVSEEPVSVRQFQPQMPRDIETICHKCLQKEPKKRYGSALALAEDLRRFVAGEPVTARPVSRLERGWRWCRRNPVVTALTATVAFLLVSAAVGAAFVAIRFGLLAQQEQRARDAAILDKQAADKARGDAVRGREEAERERERTRDLLVQQYVANATRYMDAGDFAGAMLWSAAALGQVTDDPIRQREHRARLGVLLRLSPKLIGIWETPYDKYGKDRPAFSRDGRAVLIVSENEAGLWDMTTGNRLAPALQMEGGVKSASFSADGRFVITVGKFPSTLVRVWEAASGKPVTPVLKHPAPVLHAVASPDNTHLACACTSDTILVWNNILGKPSCVPLKANGKENDVYLSPDGLRLLAVGSGSAQLWNTVTGRPIGVPMKYQGFLTKAVFDREGRPLLVALEAGSMSARVWDVATSKPLTTLLKNTRDKIDYQISNLQFSPDHARLATAGLGGIVNVWQVSTGKLAIPSLLDSNYSLASSVSFSPDGRRLVTGGSEREALVWELAGGKTATPPLSHAGWVHHAVFSPDGALVATASADETARVWDAMTGHPVSLPLYHRDEVQWVEFAPDGHHLLTLAGGLTHLWDLVTEAVSVLPLGEEPSTHAAVFSRDLRRVTTVSDKRARIWDALTGRQLSRSITEEQIDRAILSPDGLRLLTIRNKSNQNSWTWQKSSVRLWDTESGKLIADLVQLEKGTVDEAAFSRDGRWVLTASRSEEKERPGLPTRQLWDAASGRPMKIPFEPREIQGICFSSDGLRLMAMMSTPGAGAGAVSAQAADRVETWEIESGRRLSIGTLSPGQMGKPVALSPDDHILVVTSSSDKFIKPVRFQTVDMGKFVIYGIDGDNLQVAFSPDSRRMIVAGGNRLSAQYGVRIWDTQTGRALTPPMRHSRLVRKIKFSPDGELVLTVTEQGRDGDKPSLASELRIWVAATGQPLTLPLTTGSEIHDAAFALDNQSVQAVSSDGMLRRWQLGWAHDRADQVRQLASILTGRKLDQSGGITSLEVEEICQGLRTLKRSLSTYFTSSNKEVGSWRVSLSSRLSRQARGYRMHNGLSYQEAVEACNRSIELNPENWRSWFDRGILRAYYLNSRRKLNLPVERSRFLSEWDAGTDDILKGLELGGRDGFERFDGLLLNEVGYSVARMHGLDARRYQRALHLLEVACEVEASANTLNSLGVAQYRVGQYGAAIKSLERSESMRKGAPHNLVFLAMAHQQLGHEGQAREALRAFREALKNTKWAGWKEELQEHLQEVEALIDPSAAKPRVRP
jgi:WD40 repeat protein/serine/threonine protein kinase